jgi:type IV pilus assembly protein PilX
MNTALLRPRPSTNPVRAQRGLSLVTTLLFMVATLMLGVSVLSVNVMQEKTIGNTKDRDLALQAAEAALRDAESDIIRPGFVFTCPPDCTNGLYLPPSQRTPASSIPIEVSVNWDDAAQVRRYGQITGAARLPGLPDTDAAQPRYVIEKVGKLDPLPGDSKSSGSSREPGVGYRITARATGARPETVVIVQSMFTVR